MEATLTSLNQFAREAGVIEVRSGFLLLRKPFIFLRYCSQAC